MKSIRSVGYSSVCWYGRVLRREDGHVLRRALDQLAIAVFVGMVVC